MISTGRRRENTGQLPQARDLLLGCAWSVERVGEDVEVAGRRG
jgi:hypothetical protein